MIAGLRSSFAAANALIPPIRVNSRRSQGSVAFSTMATGVATGQPASRSAASSDVQFDTAI